MRKSLNDFGSQLNSLHFPDGHAWRYAHPHRDAPAAAAGSCLYLRWRWQYGQGYRERCGNLLPWTAL